MDFLGHVKAGIVKAMNAASDSHLFGEFPECSILSSVDRLSIKLQVPLGSPPTRSTTEFNDPESIVLLIRNEDRHKQVVAQTELQLNNGLVLKSGAGKPIMVLRTANNDPTSLGKLMHPVSATLYKIQRKDLCNFVVTKGVSKQPVIKVERVFASLYPIGKALGLLGCNCVYWFKRMDGTVLGYVRPKIVMSGNTLVIKFMSADRDPQTRATILGVALLLATSEAYPQLRVILDDITRSTRAGILD